VSFEITGGNKVSYLNLEIYSLAHSLAIKVHKMSLKLPKFEMYEEAQQIRRSSIIIERGVKERIIITRLDV